LKNKSISLSGLRYFLGIIDGVKIYRGNFYIFREVEGMAVEAIDGRGR
jgi:hypothetical protein